MVNPATTVVYLPPDQLHWWLVWVLFMQHWSVRKRKRNPPLTSTMITA